ncbi:MAG: opacity protein-like surface antigen [Paracoccaceae bacterium]|jgi:opacity protein-like surface antigen
MFTKLIAASASIAIISSSVLAQDASQPSMDQSIIIEEAEATSGIGDYIIPLILIAFIAAAANQTGGGGVVAISDMRAKTDIVPVGVAANGLTLYQYRYIGSEIVFEGVMAQDVLQHTPEAVITLPEGIMMVDYGLLGLRLRVVG